MNDSDWGPDHWSGGAWREAATAWMDQALAAAGRSRTGATEVLRVRRWAAVVSAPTDGGTVWLKATRPTTAFEAVAYGVISPVAAGRVPACLAADPARGWLLLEDGGTPLEGDGAAMAAVLPGYAELQRATATHVDALLAAGVADMRPALMPERFEEVLAAGIGDERPGAFRALAGRVASWSEELASAPGPAAIDHNDLHPGNVLRTPTGFCFFDWGDSVVAHPFASLFMTLGFVKDGHRAMRDAYLEAWTDLAPRAELERTLALALRLAAIPRALTMHRAFAPHPAEHATDDWEAAPRQTLAALLD